MKVFDTQHIKNIVLLGSTKSGKTTLAETMMYEGGVIKRRGTVEDGNTISDFHEIEHEKGYSIYASLMHTIWRDHKINIIDTPGNDNFIGEIVAGVRAADTCIMVLNCSQGVEIGTEVIWRYVKDAGKPVIVVANQVDHEKSDYNTTLEQAKARFGDKVVPMQYPYNEGTDFNCIIDLLKMIMYRFPPEGGKPEKVPIPAEEKEKADAWHNTLVEAAAENDDSLMELYFEKGELDEDEMRQGLRIGMMNGDVVPLFCMAAKLNMGSGRMMGFIDNVCPSAIDNPPAKTVSGDEVRGDSSEKASLFFWKLEAEQHLGEVYYFKVMSGVVRSGLDLANPRSQNSERLGTLNATIGKQKVSVDELHAGDIGAIVKLKDVKPNDSLCDKAVEYQYVPIKYPAPRIRTAVRAADKNAEEKMGEALHAMQREDPTLEGKYNSELKQTILSGQGEMHLDIVKTRLKKEYKVEVEFLKPRISYRETIQGMAKAEYRHKKQSGGSGQFGEVHIQIDSDVDSKPDPSQYKLRDEEIVDLPWGGKLVFQNCIVGGDIDTKFIPSVRKGVMEVMKEGPLTGSPVRDIRVILHGGKMHPVDSNDISFQIAASQAFKDGFQEAKPMLLEPIMDVEVLVPADSMGDVITDLQNRRSIIQGMDTEGNLSKVTAKVPLAELYKYATTLRSVTQGRAIHSREFSGYALVPENVKQDIIKSVQEAVTA